MLSCHGFCFLIKIMSYSHGVNLLFYFILFLIWPCCAASGIFVPQAGIELVPTAVKVPSPNHWTAREFH